MYTRGVAQNTRANTAIQRAQSQVKWAASKYRRVRALLIKLRPVPVEYSLRARWQIDLQVLHEKDIRGLSDGMYGDTEGTRTLSWIWMTSPQPSGTVDRDNIDTDLQLQEGEVICSKFPSKHILTGIGQPFASNS